MAKTPGEVFQQNVAFMQDYLKDKMEVCGVTLNLSPQCLAGVYCETLENYQDCVRRVCPGISQRGLNLESLTKADLHTVWGAIEERLPLQGDLDRPSTWNTNPYTFLKSTLREEDDDPKDLIECHLHIVRNLLCNATIRPDQLADISCLLYWALAFYSSIEEDKLKQDMYNKISHYFYMDLVCTFIALNVKYSSHRNLIPIQPHSLPQFKRDIICYGVTAEHSAFQRLILLNVIKILGIRIDLKSLTQLAPIHLAQLVYCYFQRDGLSWSTKGEEGLLRIVKDQTRYMTLKSPQLRRNYVADKTRRAISAIIDKYITAIPGERSRCDWVVLSKCIRVLRQRNIHSNCLLLPSTDNPSKSVKDVLNWVHHAILHEVSREIHVDEEPPPINDNGWFADVDFLVYIQELAQAIVNYTIKERSQSEHQRRASCHKLGRIAVSLQHIIAARWYESEYHHTWRMDGDKTIVDHHKVIFMFLAFRAVAVYLLPLNPHPYGVQMVAEILPQYVKKKQFPFPLQKLLEAYKS